AAEPAAPVEAAAPQVPAEPEPYSEKAWSRDSFTSDLEPQAEGALFGEQDVSASIPARTGNEYEQSASSSDAERAFDDYLANVASFTTPVPAAEPAAPVEAAAPQVPAEPEPYSEKAWSRDSFTSDSEPQAEGALFGEQDVEPKKPVYAYSDDAQLPPVSSDAERAFDDYLANVASFTTPAPAAVPAAPAQAAALTRETENTPEQTASSFDGERAFDDYFAGADAPKQTASAAPASGSTSEWSYEPTFEEAKPQSQTATYDASDEPEEEEEPKPAPRKYNEYGEIREWEPEPEPDMDDIPTVSRVIGQPDRGDDISLDDLLDEIIKAGD
ncbi:MAG: hypothetical protein VB061_09820, partial [Christensenella sp.]|nr:hypothetical protein [Christensenella sp.]